MTDSRPIVCLNSGSSSLKFALYDLGKKEERWLAQGAVERIGFEDGQISIRVKGGDGPVEHIGRFPDHASAVARSFALLEQANLGKPQAAGHRVVHGGPDHTVPEKVDGHLLDVLHELIPFAPLHLPSAIRVIENIAHRFPDLPQVACYDTAFHRRMPELAQRFPLPARYWEEGIMRYGFHGLSYEYILEALGSAGRGKVVIAHLGNGASMAAVKAGKPMDTTMGFTPAGGFMMGTRSGDLDPGILVHLMKEKGYDAERIDQLVNRESGLLGVSGLSPDMRTLLEQKESNSAASLAVEMFCYHVRKSIGSFSAVLGGLDILVFTGGIGERAALVRETVCANLDYLGIRIDRTLNEHHAGTISTEDSSCCVRVIPTNEDLMIARHTYAVCFGPIS
jgi:acetate kinase